LTSACLLIIKERRIPPHFKPQPQHIRFFVLAQKCDPIYAPIPGSFDAPNGFIVDATVAFYCPEGYQLIGSQTITCLRTRSWSDLEPTCKG